MNHKLMERKLEIATILGNGENFAEAFAGIMQGQKYTRAGWIDPFATTITEAYPFVVHMSAMTVPAASVNERTSLWIGEGKALDVQNYLSHYTPRWNQWQPGWTPNVIDLMATDWIRLANKVSSGAEVARLAKLFEFAKSGQ